MRIISGSKRGMVLETPEGLDTRPTSDRIKETLFNMIAFDIPDCCFLDLFSGSGQMGIEALSRGAKEAVFVEKDKKALSCINHNIAKAKFEDCSKVYNEDVFSALSRIKCADGFDIVFMDPPYNKLIEKQVLEALITRDYISDNTVIIVEASIETEFDYVSDLGYSITKEKVYKTNKHIFLKKA
ncbi:16S rRNA (guanine966-N2)-methyltransferase [Pseudobutyrivibrio sp. 49]|uniref:16S rRNA (guanine(966)-N(2))-methyltransferase RsmD n=1 Tax=unclassified Pseudobutyrivibrio TaxID=2638619 RepID=UPI0008842EE0|nr:MULTISPECIES: 16S rRNA (guanine(966)-N(2))-methyltransferase RsmD [unclassified Pseudobutyrivibrio]SDH45086.1 16S rRNA (guanine966-N2)-methyltransferase [Pseudobutyrivibrio sp. 49]SFN43544.1 16S rRNA (guanine966-N2)-methyltransferase [Pseudobutyrivibrio sp. UC1225]